VPVDDAFSSGKRNGTRTRPHVIPVDVYRPDNNREFEVHHVQGLRAENGRYSHPGFEITVIVPPPDAGEWAAEVVDVAGFDKRAILIRGPTGGYFLRDKDLSNQYVQVCPHPPTAAAVNSHELELAKQEDRKYTYWMLIVPDGFALDERLLAKGYTDERALVKHVAGLEKEECPITKKPLVACRVTFTIAQTGGRRRIADVQTREEIHFAKKK
jgi:hypothetical protein